MAEKANSAALPDILVVGIAGGSGGGKTTLTTNLIRRFGDKVCIVHHDNYYRAHDDLTYEERTRLNYDCPEAFETEMMIEHLRLLKQGRSVHSARCMTSRCITAAARPSRSSRGP